MFTDGYGHIIITLCLLHYKHSLVSQRWVENEIIKKNISRPSDVKSRGASTSGQQSISYTIHFIRYN